MPQDLTWFTETISPTTLRICPVHDTRNEKTSVWLTVEETRWANVLLNKLAKLDPIVDFSAARQAVLETFYDTVQHGDRTRAKQARPFPTDLTPRTEAFLRDFFHMKPRSRTP
jgi:hypothetical protein